MENKFIPSFFSGIDQSIGGFAKGQLTVVASSQYGGKMQFMINSALRQITNNQPVFIASLELDYIRCGQFIEKLFYENELPDSNTVKFMKNKMMNIDYLLKRSDEERKRDINAFFKYVLCQPNFYVLQSNCINDILQEIKWEAVTSNLDMFWLDTLQSIEADGETRDDQVEYILSSLKEVAEEFNIAIVITSQFRSIYENCFPDMSQLGFKSSFLKHASKIIYIKDAKPFDPSKSSRDRTMFVSDSTNQIFGVQSFSIDYQTKRITELDDYFDTPLSPFPSIKSRSHS